LAAARIIQNLWTYRPRPLHNEQLALVLPHGVSVDTLREWSSFPSDSSALGFALALTIWRVSRPLGSVCFLWATFVVALPRVYTGFHYPSDILGGALIGLVAAWACTRLGPARLVEDTILRAERAWPAVFYSVSFLALFQLATLFEDRRRIARGLNQAAASLF
jgi:undecaprenyl-diphosphatase